MDGLKTNRFSGNLDSAEKKNKGVSLEGWGTRALEARASGCYPGRVSELINLLSYIMLWLYLVKNSCSFLHLISKAIKTKLAHPIC